MMSETAQQAAIRRNFSKLVVGLSSQVRSVANRAYSRGLISEDLLGAEKHEIVSAINKRVTSDRDRKPFDDFVALLEEEPSTAHLAKQLRLSEEETAADLRLKTAATRNAGCHVGAFRSTSEGGIHTTQKKFDARFGEGTVLSEHPVTPYPPVRVQREKNATSSCRTYMVAPDISTVQRLTLEKRQKNYMDMLQDQISHQLAGASPTDPDSPGLTQLVDRPPLSPQVSSEASGSPVSSSEPAVMILRGEGYHKCPTALKVEGFVGEEPPVEEGRYLPEQVSQHLQVGQLLKQLNDLHEKRKEENSEAFRLYTKRRLLQKQIRCMVKEKTKLERKLMDATTNYERLKEVSKKQAAELASLFRKLKLIECELDEVSKEKSSLEERCTSLLTDLDCLKAKEEQYKLTVGNLKKMLKVAVQDACSYRAENESLKARINTLESLIDRFRSIKYESWSSSTDESSVPLLKKSYSV